MKKDLQKLKEQDLVVCDACGSDKIAEKMWVDTNSYVQINGASYYKYDGCIDDTMYWCNKCNDATHPVHISEYKGDDDAK